MHTPYTFSQNSSASDPIEIHRVDGEDEHGRQAYYYVAIHRSQAKNLFVSLKLKTTNIEQYGVILTSGFGEPDEETQAYIRTFLVADPVNESN